MSLLGLDLWIVIIQELRGCLGDCHLGKGYTALGRCCIRVSVVSLSCEKLVICNPHISLMERCENYVRIHRRMDFVFYLIIRRNLFSIIKGRSLIQDIIC